MIISLLLMKVKGKKKLKKFMLPNILKLKTLQLLNLHLQAQPSFLNVAQLTKLSVKSLKHEFTKILSAHDFSSSLPTELKELSSKLNGLNGEVKELKKHIHELLLNKVTKALNKFAHVINSASQKTKDTSVPLVGQAGTQLAKGEKNTNQVTISRLFQRKAVKDAKKAITTPPITTTVTSSTTVSLQSPFLSSPPNSSSKPEGEHIKKDKGKKAMSSKDAEEEGSESDSDDIIYLISSMVESSKKKKLKKFDFIIEGGDHIHFIEEQIKEQKKIEKSDKAEAAKHEVEVRKEELVNLLGPDVVSKEEVNACPNRKEKGWSTINGRIQTRMDYLYETEAELGIDLDKPLSEQDHLDKLNDLANKKRKNADDIHNYFRANKRLKSSVQCEDHLARTVLNEPVLGMIMFNSYHRQDFVTIEDFIDFLNEMLYTVQEIFFRLHQGPRLDDHARTFSSLLLAEVNKRNLNHSNR
ncbi:hypothetical protein Tco_0927707 [Tanacetum coccineum]